MSTDHPSRRAVLGAAGGLALTALARQEAQAEAHAPRPQATADTPRIRAGGRVQVRCPEAVAFEIQIGDAPPQRVAAQQGQATLRVPAFERAEEWTALTCTPLLADEGRGLPAVVQILTAPLVFGL